MRQWWLLSICLATTSISACTINLASQFPPLTGATLVAALRSKIHKTNCSSPEELYLDGNQIEYLPESNIFTELDWACSGVPYSQVQNISLTTCRKICNNNTDCLYISLLPDRCLLFTSRDCKKDNNSDGFGGEVLFSYRKDTALSGMENFSELTYLDLGYNRLTALSPGIGVLQQLTFLELQQNQITSLPTTVYPRLNALRYLGLAKNNLTTPSNGLFGPQLSSLILSTNRISSFPSNIFQGLNNLGYLNLEYNNITLFPEAIFSGLTKLTALYFGQNNLLSLPQGVFQGQTRLEDLRMGGSSRITSLPKDIFRNLTKLQYLDMMGWSSLSSLPSGLFQGLTSLNDVLISRANLTTLPADIFRDLSGLTSIELQNNPIRSLPADVFAGLSKLTRLELDSTVLCSRYKRCEGEVMVASQLRTFLVDPTLSPTVFPTSSPTSPTNTPTSPTTQPTNKLVEVIIGSPLASVNSTPLPLFPSAPTKAKTLPVVIIQDSSGDTPSKGAIVGGVVGAVVAIILACAFYFCLYKRSTKDSSSDTAKGKNPTATEDPTISALLLRPTPEQSAPNNNSSEQSPTSASPANWGYDVASKNENNSAQNVAASVSYNGYGYTDIPLPSSRAAPLLVFGKGSRIYTAIKVLGKGHFGTAYLVSDPQMKLFVVKTVACTDQNEALKEAKTLSLKTPTSPHLLKILDFFFEGDQLFCIVINYCQGGSLQELVSQELDLSEVERILREIATGVECLHAVEMIHRDLKPDNIFILDHETKTVVIGDMGMARSLNSDGYYDSWFGHKLYKAPEISEGKYSPRSDMWAVGCIGFELLSGETFPSRHQKTQLILGQASESQIASLLDSLPYATKQHTSFEMIRGLLLCDPRARLTAQQLKEFPRKGAELEVRVNLVDYE